MIYINHLKYWRSIWRFRSTYIIGLICFDRQYCTPVNMNGFSPFSEMFNFIVCALKRKESREKKWV